MNKLKTTYERPSTDLLVVRFEKRFLGVSGGANYTPTPGGAGGNDVYDDGESF